MTDSPVTFGCQGTCGKNYPREALKVSGGQVFCADCYPCTETKEVAMPYKRGPQPKWRKH